MATTDQHQRRTAGSGNGPSWTFLTNHAHVLVCLSADPDLRGWEIAQRVGITERAAQKIVADLIAEGYLERERVGRRNTYQVNVDLQLRHPIENQHRVGELLRAVGPPPQQGR